MERTVLYSIKNKELLASGRIFKGRYHPPSGHDWESEKQREQIAELVLIEHERPEYDRELQDVVENHYPDFEIQNDFDGEYHKGWKVIDKPEDKRQAILDRRAERKQKRLEAERKAKERKEIEDELKSTPVPSSMPELQQRIEKLEKLILDL